MPLLAASSHRLKAGLVLKCRCRLRTASKQLWCSMPLRAASPHRCTAWKQLWCSNATAGCQSAQLGSSFGAQMPLRAASSHGFEAALMLKLPLRAASPHYLKAPKTTLGAQMPLRVASPHSLEQFAAEMPQRALFGVSSGAQNCSNAAAGCQLALLRAW